MYLTTHHVCSEPIWLCQDLGAASLVAKGYTPLWKAQDIPQRKTPGFNQSFMKHIHKMQKCKGSGRVCAYGIRRLNRLSITLTSICTFLSQSWHDRRLPICGYKRFDEGAFVPYRSGGFMPRDGSQSIIREHIWRSKLFARPGSDRLQRLVHSPRISRPPVVPRH
jgi:hypothetical protein